MHRQWARFNDDVDDVVPLAVRSVHAGLAEQALSVANPVSNWVVGLSSLQRLHTGLNTPMNHQKENFYYVALKLGHFG